MRDPGQVKKKDVGKFQCEFLFNRLLEDTPRFLLIVLFVCLFVLKKIKIRKKRTRVHFSDIFYHSCCQSASLLNQLAKSFTSQQTPCSESKKEVQHHEKEDNTQNDKMTKIFIAMRLINKTSSQILMPASDCFRKKWRTA